MESNRNIDMKAEKQLASFLDEHFYSRLHDKNGISVKFDRKKDKTSQLQGIDVELNADGKTFILYTPDTPLDEIPEALEAWDPYRFNEDGDSRTTLGAYALYNEATGDGFFSYTE